MTHWTKSLAPAAVLALSTALSGCYVSTDWGEVEGVPLAELDMSGDAPSTIRLLGPDNVVIAEGDTLAITLDGNSEAGEALRFDRDGDRLSIARDKEVYDGSRTATIRITMPAPAGIHVAGSGLIESETVAATSELEIAGSGNIRVKTVEAEELDVDIAGSGKLTAAGTAQKLDIEIAGSGDVRFSDLVADTVSVSIAGSGDVDVASNGSVDASIAGSGDIRVTGSATCSVSTAGSGSLTCSPGEQTADTTSEDAAEGSESAAE